MEIPKAYVANKIEGKWYRFWEEKGFFQADPSSKKPPFCISIPPPNITGALHMGHALVNTLQDILIRWKRMQGFETLWVPGCDHAGIATQTVVEKHLIATLGKSRKDFSREEFLTHIWEWKEQNENRIIDQLKSLGASCDWSRIRFTMDKGCNQSVKKAFKTLFDKGYIYRGDYLVNWDPVTQTALADDEVEYEERDSFLWTIKYPLSDGSGSIQISTTRPETMLGDTAVAVNPNDKRYQKFIGKTIVLPLVNREVPIISDFAVDTEFGTGAVKVTPAHDPNDYQMAFRHQLPMINIMTPDGKINENGNRYSNLSIPEAREAVVADLKKNGFLEKIVPYHHRVGVSYRSKATIQPYLSKQWFVKMEPFKDQLRSAVTDERVKLIPKMWENTYFHWIDNLRDWCISRQLWWGHRIPIWYHRDDPEKTICFDGDGTPPQVTQEPHMWYQDEDVLDTWFSSALWPFSNLGWPDNTEDLKRFYPNSTLITGHDILFFWVARMIIMGEILQSKAPFPEVFLHGLIFGKSYWRTNPEGGITYIQDKERLSYDLGSPVPNDVQSKWEKMSKSKGNIIDPLEIMDEYGTDAMRMALASVSGQSREIDLDRRRFDDFKNFTNKLWNGARFVFMNLEDLSPQEFCCGLDESLFLLEDRWILSLLNRTVDSVNSHLEKYEFDQAAIIAYEFFWKEFCAYYVEISKPILFGKTGTKVERCNKQKLLLITLLQSVRLIHPMAPFISEELFQLLKEKFPSLTIDTTIDPYTLEAIKALNSSSCMVSPYPLPLKPHDQVIEIEEAFSCIDRIIYTIRNIRGEMKIPPGMETDIHIVALEGNQTIELIKENKHILYALTRIQNLLFHDSEPNIGFTANAIVDGIKILIPIPDSMKQKEKIRLEKECIKLETFKEKLDKQLSDPSFMERAPEKLVQKQKEQLENTLKELVDVQEKLKSFLS